MSGAYLFSDAARLVALVPMKPSAIMVLWHLIARLDNREWRKVTQIEIAGELGIDRGSVSRALAELRERGLVTEKNGAERRLTPFLVWKGTQAEYARLPDTRKAEATEAAAWHECRAIMNLDADGPADGMAFDPAGREAAMLDLLQGDRPTDEAAPEPKVTAVPKPNSVSQQEWEAVQARLCGWGDDGLRRVHPALQGRLPDEDIQDWLDDYIMKYYGDPEMVAACIADGIIAERPL